MLYKAKFYNGNSAESLDVLVSLGDTGINLTGRVMGQKSWGYKDLVIHNKPEDGLPLTIMIKPLKGGQLVVLDSSIFSALQRKLPRRNIPFASISTSYHSIIFWLLVAGCVGSSIYVGIKPVLGYIAKHVPRSWEEKLGNYAMDILVGDKAICDSPKGKKALDKLADSLTINLQSKIKYDVQVVDDKRINAFAVPAGKIVIMKGLLKQANSPEEVEGVLSHEMGHVIARHPIQGVAHGLGLSLLGVMITGGGDSANAVKLGSSFMQLQYSRTLEEEADESALDILKKAKISPEGLAEFFERMNKKSSVSDLKILSYISTHPANIDRIAKIRKGSGVSSSEPILTPQEWDALQTICD